MHPTVICPRLARIVCVLCAAWLIPAPASAEGYFNDDQKEIIAAAEQRLQDEMRTGGISGVQAEVHGCYETASKKGLIDILLYCVALDTAATLFDGAYSKTMHTTARTQYFTDDAYDTRARKHLTQSSIANPYEQTQFIEHLKDEVNHVTSQYIQRRMAESSPDEQDEIKQRLQSLTPP